MASHKKKKGGCIYSCALVYWGEFKGTNNRADSIFCKTVW